MAVHDVLWPRAGALGLLFVAAALAPGCSGGRSDAEGSANPGGAPEQGRDSAARGEPPQPTADPDAAPHGGSAAGAAPEGGDPHASLPFFRGDLGDPGEGGAGSELAWIDPAGWLPVEPASRMRWAQYALPPAGIDTEEGECVVFYFGPGQGGDPQANAERWAGQFEDPSGAPPKPELEESQVGGRRVMRVTVEGTYAPSPMMGGEAAPPKAGYKLLGAIVEGPDANWFFKCTGPMFTMDAHRPAFDGLIASVRSR